VKIGLIVVGLFMLVAVAVMAAPDDRFKGSEFDGYEVCSTNNSAIPKPPDKGLVIMIR